MIHLFSAKLDLRLREQLHLTVFLPKYRNTFFFAWNLFLDMKIKIPGIPLEDSLVEWTPRADCFSFWSGKKFANAIIIII